MSNKRVFVLHSFKDKGYEARLQQIASNPSLDEISFRHFCVIDHERPSVRIPELDRLADRDEGIEELLKELNKETGGQMDTFCDRSHYRTPQRSGEGRDRAPTGRADHQIQS